MQVLIQGINAYCTDIFSANFHIFREFSKAGNIHVRLLFQKCFKTKSEKKIIVKIFKAKKNPAAPFKTHIFTTCCERAIYMFFNVRC